MREANRLVRGLVVLGFLVGCQSQTTLPSSPAAVAPMIQAPPVPESGVFFLGVESDLLKLSDGTEIELVFEGPSKAGLLRSPGLRVSSPRMPDEYLGGLGLFHVRQRPILVEWMAHEHTYQPHLRVTIGRPGETWSLIPVEEAVSVAINAMREADVGFARYGWSANGSKLTVLAHLEGDSTLAWADVDRYRNKLDFLSRITLPSFSLFGDSKFVLQTGTRRSSIEFQEGEPDARRELGLIGHLFAECAQADSPSFVDVVVDREGYRFVHESGKDEKTHALRSLERCLDDPMKEWSGKPSRFRVHLEYVSTMVESDIAGDGVQNLPLVGSDSGWYLNLTLKAGSPDVRNTLRRRVRYDWQNVMACGAQKLEAKGRVETNGNVVLQSQAGCLAKVVSGWNLGEREAEEEVAFDMELKDLRLKTP